MEPIVLRGEIPDPTKVPGGCRFHPRCPALADGSAAAAGVADDCETVTLPVPDELDPSGLRPLLGVLELLYVAAGTSYYKVAAPPRVANAPIGGAVALLIAASILFPVLGLSVLLVCALDRLVRRVLRTA